MLEIPALTGTKPVAGLFFFKGWMWSSFVANSKVLVWFMSYGGSCLRANVLQWLDFTRARRGCDFIYEFIDAIYCHFFYRGRSELSFGWHIRHTLRSPCGDVSLHHYPQLRSFCAALQYSDWNRRCTSMPTSDPLLLGVVLSEHQVRTKKLFTEAHHCGGVANCSVTQKPFFF